MMKNLGTQLSTPAVWSNKINIHFWGSMYLLAFFNLLAFLTGNRITLDQGLPLNSYPGLPIRMQIRHLERN
jgi:hypothetical protein